MQIHLARNGQMLGQFEPETIPAMLQAGTALPSDLYWHEGMAEWAEVKTKWSTPALVPVAEPPTLHAPVAEAAPAKLDLAAIVLETPEIMRGARWFWWIAGLSLLNTILAHSGANMSFVVGLGFTQIADAIFQKMKIIAFVIDVLAIGFYFGVGWFAGKGRFWAFVLGVLAYLCDTAIFVLVQEWRSLAFHVIALFFIIRGAVMLRKVVKEARTPELVAQPATNA